MTVDDAIADHQGGGYRQDWRWQNLVQPIEQAIQIRTGESGEEAV